MKCSKCHKKNIVKANYCRYCGNKFSEKEKTEARKKSLVGRFEMLKDWYEACTLKTITDDWRFKIAVLAVILGIGIYNFVTMGANLKIIDSDIYNLQYNKTEDSYYVIVDKENRDNIIQVALDLFIPNKIETLRLTHYDENGKVISNDTYEKGSQILVSANVSNNNYYVIANNSNEKEKIKFYVYYGD